VFALAILAADVSFAAQRAPTRAISAVTISRPFFNPALGQRVTVALSLARAGSLEVDILDSERATVRRILSRSKARPGKTTIDWNGRDEKGAPLPDGVYSLVIKLVWSGGSETYSPGALQPEEWIVYGATYDHHTRPLSSRPFHSDSDRAVHWTRAVVRARHRRPMG
jgi:hypothetical protein